MENQELFLNPDNLHTIAVVSKTPGKPALGDDAKVFLDAQELRYVQEVTYTLDAETRLPLVTIVMLAKFKSEG